MRVAIVGAGTTGLFAAILLARDGHEVALYERDARPDDVDAASVARWKRPGTPQAHLPHALVAYGRHLLAAHTPDVMRGLYEVGAIDFAVGPLVPGGASDPSDDELRILFCRRPLIEAVLWRVAGREPAIALHAGAAVTSLEALRADVIVDAAGRRSPVAKWLDAPEPLVEECGLIYYSRYYRLRPEAELPRGPWLWGPRAELPYALAIVHLADRGVYSITFGVPPFDTELKILREARAFEAAVALLPAFSPWNDPERAEPIGDVFAMGGLQNVLREHAYAPGVIAIGDALCHTNAAYGWGISLGFGHAAALVEALRARSSIDDATRAFHARVGAEARARWNLSTQLDRARVCMWRGQSPSDGDALAAAQRALAPAMMLDPAIFRASLRVMLALAPPDALLDPALHARARAAVTANPPPASRPSPSREAILAAARAAG